MRWKVLSLTESSVKVKIYKSCEKHFDFNWKGEKLILIIAFTNNYQVNPTINHVNELVWKNLFLSHNSVPGFGLVNSLRSALLYFFGQVATEISYWLRLPWFIQNNEVKCVRCSYYESEGERMRRFQHTQKWVIMSVIMWKACGLRQWIVIEEEEEEMMRKTFRY